MTRTPEKRRERDPEGREQGERTGEGEEGELRTLLDLRVHIPVKMPCKPVRGYAMILS